MPFFDVLFQYSNLMIGKSSGSNKGTWKPGKYGANNTDVRSINEVVRIYYYRELSTDILVFIQ